jgi:hypothetical protein
MKNWNQQEVEVATSKGGVIALANPHDNLVTTGVAPWPPSEIIQKLYQSSQARAFVDNQKEKSTECLGYYSDLQSINSEDAITWSVFGTVAHSSSESRNKFISDLFQNIGIHSEPIRNSEIFLWRRIPHPDTLVSGGPEIDFGIFTGDILLLGEAKWKSSVGVAQGKNKDKDQIQLRVEFLNKYGLKLYPKVKQFVVLGIGLQNDVTENIVDNSVKCVGKSWNEICGLASHPHYEELQRYLAWKKENTKKG